MYSASVCDDKKLNRGYYGGSFTGINMNRAAASISVADLKGAVKSDFKENWFDKMLKLCDKHTVIAQNLVALVLATVFRPAAIMSLPGKKNKDDKIYASGHSIASGVIGFGFSSVVMYPLGQAVAKSKQDVAEVAATPTLQKYMGKSENEILQMLDSLKTEDEKAFKDAVKDLKRLDKLKEKFDVKTLSELADKIKEKHNVKELADLENVKLFKKFKEIYKVENLTKLEQSHAFKMVTKFLDMAPDVFIFGLLKAMLTIALIPPILKYGFGVEKNKSSKPQPEQQPSSVQVSVQMMPKPEINKFAGGLK